MLCIFVKVILQFLKMISGSIEIIHGSQYDDISIFCVSNALLSMVIPAVKYLRNLRE